MRKVFLTLAVALMSLTVVNAQLVIGGGFGIGGDAPSSTKIDGKLTNKGSDRFYFNFNPKVGYMLMDGKMEVGGVISLGYNHQTSFQVVDEKAKKDMRNYNVSLYFNPYVRYYFLQKGCFNLGIQGYLGLGGYFEVASKAYEIDGVRTKDDAKDMNKDAKDAIKDKKPVHFAYGLGLSPVVMFNVNEHWYIDITIDALGLYLNGNYDKREMKDGITSKNVKIENNSFSGGLSMFSEQNGIAIGAAYKF